MPGWRRQNSVTIRARLAAVAEPRAEASRSRVTGCAAALPRSGFAQQAAGGRVKPGKKNYLTSAQRRRCGEGRRGCVRPSLRRSGTRG